jgi:phosphoribosylglycinamide formyltransferase-1
MAGFMTILDKPFIDRWPGRVLNTHPSLLPSFPGAHGVRDALEAGVKITGCTVHIATAELDAGPIVAQAPVEVLADDSVESLHERIKVVERTLYPSAIRTLMEDLS